VVLSRATEISQTLQEVLCVLHNDAFMQHGMLCLYDNQQEILSIEALQEADQHLIPGSSQIRYRPGEGLVGPCFPRGNLVLPRVADDQRFLDRLHIYDYNLPFIAVPLMGPGTQPIGVLALSRWRVWRSDFLPVRAFWKLSPIWSHRQYG
jgi:Nif-specific regulatory protein